MELKGTKIEAFDTVLMFISLSTFQGSIGIEMI